MSTEILNRTSVVTKSDPEDISVKKDLTPKKVNIDVLKKRVFNEKKKRKISKQSFSRNVLSFNCIIGVHSCLIRNIIKT